MKVHVRLTLDTTAFRRVLSLFQASPEARDKVDKLDELGILTRFDDMMKNYGCKVDEYITVNSEVE